MVHLIMLLRDFMRVSPYRRRTVRSLLQTLVADVQEIRDGQTPDGPEREARPRELFAEFKRLVHKHCARERNIPFYAAQLHVSPHHLSAIIKYCCPLNLKTTRFPYPQRPSIGVADSFFEK